MPPVFGVKVAGGLVGEDQLGFADQGAGHGDALLLAAGELLGHVFGAVGEADALEHLGDAAFALGGGDLAVDQSHLDVLGDVEVVDEVEALEDEADADVAADDGELVLGVAGHVLAEKHVGARGRLVDEAQHVEQRRLAAAGRSHDGQELAGRDLE